MNVTHNTTTDKIKYYSSTNQYFYFIQVIYRKINDISKTV